MSRKPSVQSLISAGQGSNKNYIFEEYTMKQAVLLIDCYLYGTIAILAVVLLVLVYLFIESEDEDWLIVLALVLLMGF